MLITGRNTYFIFFKIKTNSEFVFFLDKDWIKRFVFKRIKINNAWKSCLWNICWRLEFLKNSEGRNKMALEFFRTSSIIPLLLSDVKKRSEGQIFVAFSEYLNFKSLKITHFCSSTKWTISFRDDNHNSRFNGSFNCRQSHIFALFPSF